ncbi:hypothetical protein HMPREF9371_2406 [Neisseria shayeganii 871]|uniref:Uncharacterized protein n=1 Tax=Neisseria shayeganii 871 TaxID=1032488 RepID=G4CLB5_9NEIS|nr:hypothetical protein HMPREF9371_2406 [Neisseria shayeganii 871]
MVRLLNVEMDRHQWARKTVWLRVRQRTDRLRPLQNPQMWMQFKA